MNQEHVTKYFDKSGDEYISTTNLIENEHGFASYLIRDDFISIINVYGDGRYWRDLLNDIAKENGCKTMRFITNRNPEAFERSLGFKVIGYMMEKEVE